MPLAQETLGACLHGGRLQPKFSAPGTVTGLIVGISYTQRMHMVTRKTMPNRCINNGLKVEKIPEDLTDLTGLENSLIATYILFTCYIVQQCQKFLARITVLPY